MNVEMARDIAAPLDVDLLQLSEISPLALKQNPSIAEHLYSQWLSRPETLKLVLYCSFCYFLCWFASLLLLRVL